MSMRATEQSFPLRGRPERQYVRPPRPLIFPTSAEMPETGVHLDLRTSLYLTVRYFVGARGAVGSEQFVYWDAEDPRRCLAPDLMVRMGAAPGPFPLWKTWERGAPHLAVEIVSPSDAPDLPWGDKLRRYRASGIAEVVRFDPVDRDRPLRLWDRLEDDLVERVLVGQSAFFCDTLDLYWCVRPHPVLGLELRLARDATGKELVLSNEEEALKRVAELEAELARQR